MLPYQAVAMDYAVSSGFQRQTPIGLGVNINPAFTHSWFVPADLCVTYKQTPLLEPGHVILLYYITLRVQTALASALARVIHENCTYTGFQIITIYTHLVSAVSMVDPHLLLFVT